MKSVRPWFHSISVGQSRHPGHSVIGSLSRQSVRIFHPFPSLSKSTEIYRRRSTTSTGGTTSDDATKPLSISSSPSWNQDRYIQDFLTLKLPWSQERWMKACCLMFDSVIGGPQHQDQLLELLLHKSHVLDHEQNQLLLGLAANAMHLHGWTPHPKIFRMLIQHALRCGGHVESAETFLKHFIILSSSDATRRNRILPHGEQFTQLVIAWGESNVENKALRIHSFIQDWWLPLYRRTSFPASLRPTETAYSICLVALCNNGRPELALDMLKRIRLEAEVDQFWPSAFLYNSVMNWFAKTRNVEVVEQLFLEMLMDYHSGKNPSCRPDIWSFATLMEALAKSKKHRKTAAQKNEELLDRLCALFQNNHNLHELRPNAYIYGIVINSWAQCTTAKDAPQRAGNVLRRMIEEGITPTMPCYNAILNAWARAAKFDPTAPEKLEELWEEFSSGENPHRATFSPNRFSFMARISAWERSQREVSREESRETITKNNVRASQMALQALNELLAMTTPLEPYQGIGPCKKAIFNRTILALSRVGNVQEVDRLVKQMQSSNDPEIKPDESTLAFCIKACQCSLLSDAAERAEQILLNDLSTVKPVLATMNSLLACWRQSNRKEAPERALFWLKHMTVNYGLYPNMISHTEVMRCILLSKHDHDEQKSEWLRQVITEMETRGKKLNLDSPIHRSALAFLSGESPLPPEQVS